MRSDGLESNQAAALTIKGNRALVTRNPLVSLNFLRDSSRLAVSGWVVARLRLRPKVCVGKLSAIPDRCITAHRCVRLGQEFWCQAKG